MKVNAEIIKNIYSLYFIQLTKEKQVQIQEIVKEELTGGMKGL
jgi:hypothetical protein